MEQKLRESETRITTISNNMPALISYVDQTERYQFSNNYLGASIGMQPRAMIGRTMRDVCPPALYAEIEPHIKSALAGRRVSFDGEIIVGGKIVHHETHYIPDAAADGRVAGFYAMSIDVTARKLVEETLYREHERLDVTLSSIGDAVITTDALGRITYLNPVAERMCGWTNSHAAGEPLDKVFKVVNEKTRRPAANPIEQALRENRTVALDADTVLVRPDGSEIGIEDSAAPIHDRNLNVIGGVLVFHDVTESRGLAARLAYQAQHDALTGLPNRLLLLDRIAQAIAGARRRERNVGLLFIDLDLFKPVNDTLSHAAGDELLKQVSQRLSAGVRASDSVARIGGDEFVVLIPDLDNSLGAAQLADKLREAIAEPFDVAGHQATIGASIGISMFPDNGEDANTLLKNADTAMYEVKAQGRNRFQFFAPAMHERATSRFKLETQLRRTIAKNDFELHYQPKVHYPSGRIIGAEALIRMRVEDGRLVSPGDFVPLAEEIGLIGQLGAWALRETTRQIAVWEQLGVSVPIAVNVSALELKQKDYVASVRDALASAGVSAQSLELELTESALMDLGENYIQELRELVGLGLKLAIDDFGTGYSSLSYLNRLPTSTLKIDRSFVTDVATRQDAASITLAIINLAGSLGLSVIAEGVESEAQTDCLHAQGCEVMQGYFFHRPLTAENFLALMQPRADAVSASEGHSVRRIR
jgi:diguanylate cyclase (GGDEF)-like protein/PAS domain S-box-containing protein